MRNLNFLFFNAIFFIGTLATAQNTSHKFIVGLGTHAVDYYGVTHVSNVFNLENWNIQYPISRVTFGYSLNPWLALDAAVSMGSIKNTRMSPEAYAKKQFFTNSGVGLRFKFANGSILKEEAMFDPYIRAGLNYHYYDYTTGYYSQNPRPGQESTGYNERRSYPEASLGAGFNFWFTDKVGFNWQTDFNTSLIGDNYRQFLQHSAGIVFRFGGPDQDKDGVLDDKDLCPTVPGPKKLQGCPDTDGDGFLDKDDKCPTIKGEFEGCPDTDGDGLHDGIDKCPTVAGPKENVGCPWPDSDGDGVADKDDKCPTVAGSFDGCPDTDGDGFPDNIDQCPTVAGTVNGCPDSDGDGVADKDDKCPSVAGPASNNGCPKIEVKDKDKLTKMSKSIYFISGSAKLTANSQTILKDVATIMNKYPNATFSIEGHTDNTGSASKNEILSQQRADAVKKFLANNGVNNSLISKGFGSTLPIADNKTASGRTQNRRVVISLKEK